MSVEGARNCATLQKETGGLLRKTLVESVGSQVGVWRESARRHVEVAGRRSDNTRSNWAEITRHQQRRTGRSISQARLRRPNGPSVHELLLRQRFRRTWLDAHDPPILHLYDGRVRRESDLFRTSARMAKRRQREGQLGGVRARSMDVRLHLKLTTRLHGKLTRDDRAIELRRTSCEK